MANLALHLGVLAGEREISLVVIKLGRLFPVALGVALGAVGAQGFLVLVVFLVAVVAACGELVFVDPTGGVAGIALGALVFAQQVVLGVTVVVEGDRLPALRVVALLALLAVVTLVLVFLLVAGVAIVGRVLVLGVLVAILALHVHMLAFEREVGLVVVNLGFFPIGLGVAISALVSQRTLVGVVLLVTCNALAVRDAVTLFLAAGHMLG